MKSRKTRNTHNIFDLIFKILIRSCSRGVIHLINGLFHEHFPLDSTVEYPNNEHVSRKLKHLYSDTMIIIGGSRIYNLESQTSDDDEIALRVFEYGFEEGKLRKTVERDIITLKFPQAKIIFLETTGKTPDRVTLRLIFPDGSLHDYQVETFKPLDYPVEELEKQNMTLLLPLYLLKLRRAFDSAGTPEERQSMMPEIKALLDKLTGALERSGKIGVLEERDISLATDLMDRLHNELYNEYTGSKETGMAMYGIETPRYDAYMRMEAEIKKARTSLAEATTNLAETKTNLAEATTNLAETKTNLAETKTNLAETKTNLAEAEKKAAVRDKEIARKMKADGLPVYKIAAYTGLPPEAVEQL